MKIIILPKNLHIHLYFDTIENLEFDQKLLKNARNSDH